jgi:hypothetical protein
MEFDDERTPLRLSLLSGYIISACPSAVIIADVTGRLLTALVRGAKLLK